MVDLGFGTPRRVRINRRRVRRIRIRRRRRRRRGRLSYGDLFPMRSEVVALGNGSAGLGKSGGRISLGRHCWSWSAFRAFSSPAALLFVVPL